MLKAEEIANENSCLNRSQPEEPVFVLCARDSLAADVVSYWIARAKDAGVSKPKIQEAQEILAKFRDWAEQKGTKVPD